MRKNSVLALGLCAAFIFTGCKSRESAYRQAYEQAMKQETSTATTTPAVETPAETTVVVAPTPITPSTTVTEDHSDVREIAGPLTVIAGQPLKTYSVVVGSFVTQANAEGQRQTLVNQGYEARVVKTNETINNVTGWYRVVASSYDDKASAVSQRNALSSKYPGAWLLYRK